MVEEKYILEENPIYKDDDIRKLQNTDDANADTVVNPLFLRILNNIRALFRLISNKVDKVKGKGLSTNDYTTAEKTTLAKIEEKAKLLKQDERWNYGFGTDALSKDQPGDRNIAIGHYPLQANTTGFDNVAIGHKALYINSTGGRNIAIGYIPLFRNTTGGHNMAIGYVSLSNNTEGSDNVALGPYSLQLNTTGDDNIAIGRTALYSNSTGSNNVALGCMALGEGHPENLSNSTGIGYYASVTGSNQVQLGNSITTVYTYGAVQNRSDSRDKSDIRDTVLGLDFIKALRPVDFKWDYREDYNEIVQVIEDVLDEDGYPEQTLVEKQLSHSSDGTKTRKRYHHGLIAQEVKQVIDATGIDFGGYQDHSVKGGNDVLSIGYSELIAPLIKAVQELSVKAASLQEQLDEIKQSKAGI